MLNHSQTCRERAGMMNNNSDLKECKIFHWQFPAIIQAERMAEYAVIVSEKAFLGNGTKDGKERKDGKQIR